MSGEDESFYVYLVIVSALLLAEFSRGIRYGTKHNSLALRNSEVDRSVGNPGSSLSQKTHALAAVC